MKHERSLGRRRDGVWWAGLVVASTAAAATAHGLYAVAEASDVPWPVAVLYPVMIDGLALVAYSATNRLTDGPRRYAWTVVVAAAGLSGAAQAVYLAGGGLADAPAGVRFGIGAAPAVAAAAVAHLLHLIRTAADTIEQTDGRPPAAAVQAEPAVQQVAVQSVFPPEPAVRTPAAAAAARTPAPSATRPDALRASASVATGAAERGRDAASRYREQHAVLPTVSELVRLADVSRGTAGTVLKGLRTASPDQSRPDHCAPGLDDHPSYFKSRIQSDYTPRHHDPKEDQHQGLASSEPTR